MTSLISVQGFLFYCNIDILISCRFLKCPFRRESPLHGHFTRTSFIDIHLSHLSMWMKTITVFMCECGCVGVCAIFMSVCVYVKMSMCLLPQRSNTINYHFLQFDFQSVQNNFLICLLKIWHHFYCKFYGIFIIYLFGFLKLLKARNLSHKFVINNLIISLINNTDTI